jgi:hypothetical protein
MNTLRVGFWPFNNGDWKLDMKDDPVERYPPSTKDIGAIREFCDKEIAEGRWSGALTLLQLPVGTKISPLFVRWQPDKARIITDHSASGLNDYIPRDEAHILYDDLRSFGQVLYDAAEANPGRDIITFKDDVASAFLNLPVHPFYQIRQLVSVDDHYHVIRRLVFGNRASPRCWCSVSSLLCWIATVKFGIRGLHVYMDDFFGWDFADNLIMFQGKSRPRKQVQLLIFWDFISCPFESRKQDHGAILKIIGFWVDTQNGSISLPPDSIANIIDHIQKFLATPSRNPPLREWQRLLGHLNWALNVFPLARPALSSLYRKLRGKKLAKAPIIWNATNRSDLAWLLDVIPKCIGVRFIDDGQWADCQADFVLWTDASLTKAMSFVYASAGFVYEIRPPPKGISIDIFFLELVAILSAIHHTASFNSPPRHVLIYTDSLDSVCAYNSLAAGEAIHNNVLLAIAKVCLESGLDIRLRHIPSQENRRADMLSRLMFTDYHLQFPHDRVRTFSPPRGLLPARWQGCF